MRKRIGVSLDDEHHEIIAGLIDGGFFKSKSEVVRYAMKLLTEVLENEIK